MVLQAALFFGSRRLYASLERSGETFTFGMEPGERGYRGALARVRGAR